ncbi:MAG: hemerythrin domain-containing protein [Burkholderiales bacterium]|nr:hemerythrin domain-containing protein [Burkholderiales bacterium]
MDASVDANSLAKQMLLTEVMDDHRRFQVASGQAGFLAEDSAGDLDGIVARACDELLVHAQLEQEVLYPAVRAAIVQKQLVDEAELESETINNLAAELRNLFPRDERYLPAISVLGKFVQLHMESEEIELFPLLEESALDWNALLRQWRQRKAALRAERGLVSPESDPETVD